MKFIKLLLLLAAFAGQVQAQVGIGTFSPNSMLDVRGSFSSIYRSFSTSTTASSTDFTLAFNGTIASALTLPDATICQGRLYIVKNSSGTLPTPVLTINTTSGQTIDGAATYALSQALASVVLISTGTNWEVFSPAASSVATKAWLQGGNTLASLQPLGTISNFDLPFITNNVENMRLSAAGNLGIGTATFSSSNPEKLVVNTGTSSTVNAIVGKGNTNNYLQLNIQNSNAGTNASSDVVATADNGTETTNYIDMGINSSANTSGVMGALNDAYLYNIGQNLLIGTGAASKSLVFMTGGTAQSTNERMRIDGAGNVGIGTILPGNKLEVNSGTGGVSGLRLKQLPAGSVLFMGASADVTQNNSNFYFDGTNYRLSIGAGTSPASTLQVGGSLATAIVTKTGSYTASANDHTIIVNNPGPATIALPPASGCSGRIYVVKKTSTAGSNVTISANGSDTIDGSATQVLTTQYSSYMLQSDGTNWYILSKN